MALALTMLAFAMASCGGTARAGAAPFDGSQASLRLGYIPNVTHAQPLVGLENGAFQDALGPDVRLELRLFNAGPSIIEALFAGAIDAAYIGPSPTINGHVQSRGRALRIVAGAASGGASLVVRNGSGIEKAADLAKRKIGTPQLGNTQDVALRVFLMEHGLAPVEERGNVLVYSTSNASILTLFKKGDLDAAWVPEPWATRLVQEAGGRIFVDERTLWPNGDFVTTHLIVSTGLLERRPDIVEKLVRAHVDTTIWINGHTDEAAQIAARRIENDTGARLPVALVQTSWERMRITNDPVALSLRKSADDAYRLGFIRKRPDLSEIYSLTILDAVLREKGLEPVDPDS